MHTYKFVVNGGYMALDRTANGLGQPVIISNSGTNDHGVFVNIQTWANHSDQIVQVRELRHARTGNCVNYSQGLLGMTPGVAGDKDELFWMDPAGSITVGPSF